MTELSFDRHLTKTGSHDKHAAVSWDGQAYFAGTGPKGKLCQDCAHWNLGRSRRRHTNQTIGTPRDGACSQFIRLLTRKIKSPPKPPGTAQACKYFEQYEGK
jgi:hypothetical protein